MKATFILFVFLIAIQGIAQDRNSLRAQLDSASNDTVRLDLYQKLASTFQGRNKDSLVLYAVKSLSLSKKLNHPKEIAASFNLIGNANFLEANYDSAVYFYSEGYDQALIAKDTMRQGALLGNIGMVLTYQGKYDTSIQVLLKALEIREAVGDPKASGTVNNLGNAYYRIGDYDKALVYYKEAAKSKEAAGQTRSLSNTLNNIGIILKNLRKYEEAIPYYLRSLEIAEEFQDIPKQANAHNNLATLYRDGNIDNTQAEYHFRLAIKKKKEIGDKGGLYNSLVNYAELLSTMRRSKEALSKLEEAEKLQEQLGQTMYDVNGLQMKASILADLGRFEEAYQTYRKSYVKRVDELNEDKVEKIAEWEAKYETSKKEAEIEQLSLENQLQSANLAKSRNAQIAIGTSSIMMAAILLVYFNQRNKKLRAEQEAQELQIEALEKRLIDLNISPSKSKVDISELNKKIHSPLSEREFEVLELSLDGKSNAVIAERLFISLSTVKFHLRNTYSKLGVSNRKEALQYVAKKS